MKNQRLKYFSIIVIVIISGILSRKVDFIPVIVGDILWAAMVYFGFRFLIPSKKKSIALYLALAFSFFIEFSQLYQADWINQIRNTFLGSLVLGHGFLWIDLLAYSIGIIIAGLFDR